MRRKPITGTGRYPAGRGVHFQEGARCNVAAYAPRERADAFPGAPAFPLHATVLWYPGRMEEVVLHSNRGAQTRWLAAHGFAT